MLKPLALASVLAVALQFAACAGTLLEDGKDHYNGKRFHAAADTFQKAVEADPANPEGYYWLGRALEELKDRNGAKTMYLSAFKLNPFGPHAHLAKQALMDLAARQAQLDHPTDGPEVMAQTLALIERQAGDWKTMKIHDGNQTANRRVYEGAMQAARYGYYQPHIPYLPQIPENKPNMQPIDIRQIRAGTATPNNPYTTVNINQPQFNNWAGYPGGGAGAGPTTYGGGALGAPFNGTGAGANGFAGHNFPPLPPMPGLNNYYGPNDNINPAANVINPMANWNLYGQRGTSNYSALKSSYIRSDSAVQAMRAQQEAVHSATELQKSANNLQSLLGEQPKYGTPHLRALGTNLFVRNYSEHDDDSTPPVDPPLELKAKAVKLSDLEKGDKGEKAKQLKFNQ